MLNDIPLICPDYQIHMINKITSGPVTLIMKEEIKRIDSFNPKPTKKEIEDHLKSLFGDSGAEIWINPNLK